MLDATEADHDHRPADSTPTSPINDNVNGTVTNRRTQTEPDEVSIKHENIYVKTLVSAHDPETPRPASLSKKRKLEELDPRSRSVSRAVSPPWKSFAADGPTQFTEDGKRRSGRVNHIPLDLQPPSDKRTTRKAHEAAASNVKHKSYALSARRGRLSNGISSSPAKAEGKPSPSKLKTEGVSSLEDELAGSDVHVAEDVKPMRISSRPKTAPKHFDDIVVATDPPVTSPPVKRRPGRPRKESITEPQKSRTSILQSRRLNRAATTADKDELSVPHISPRVRLKLPRGAITPRHPDCFPKPSKYSSLTEILEDFDRREKESGPADKNENDSLDTRGQPLKPERSPAEEALEEARVRLRIIEAGRPGGVLSEEKSSLYFPDDQPEPPHTYTHSDHLWSQGAYFRVLLRRERAKHIELAKRTAYACQAKWKERQPQTEDEKVQQENEWFKLIYKQTVRDMQRKWELITGEIDRRRLAAYIEEQELTRDRKMQRLLEDTTKMLDRRRTGFEETESAMEDQDEGENDDESAGSFNDSASSTDEEEDHIMTSSESESGSDTWEAMDVDQDLSPEALRAKYANLPALEPEADGAEGVDDETDGEAAPGEEQAEDMSHVVLDEVDQTLLDDEDDESTDMSDDMGSSDEDEESGSESGSDEGEESAGLMGFFGGADRKKFSVTEPEEDDEDVSTASPVVLSEELDVEKSHAAADATDHASRHLTVPPVVSLEDDHSSQPTPADDSTTAHTEAESTTSVDPEEMAKLAPNPDSALGPRSITTPVPTLLRGTLREYQHFGLDWLAKLYANQTNGILADEMGLGKTIQTIALLAHLAEEHEVWGPHLIVVPTSVILNWEMEFKKFLPGFKVLSYYGTQEERQQKRKGWSNPDNYNVVITSYQLILKDLSSIRVPEWHYMILDEAHNIKNFQSQRYQAMIRLKTHARLLLTGTPLQNSIQELWSLLTFLTAGQDGQGMGDLDEFTQWFKRPVDEIFVDGKNKLGIEAQEIVNKLHHSLRPYILRRMKLQVEKQLPGKFEHTVFCRLSKRQRQLYDAFLSRADVKEKLSSGNPISVSQALMALRKVCNHPDLFEERPIVTSFTMRKPYSRVSRSAVADFEIKDLIVRRKLLNKAELDSEFDNLIIQNFDLQRREQWSKYHAIRGKQLSATKFMGRWLQHYHNQRAADAPISGTLLSDVLAHCHHSDVQHRLNRLESYIAASDKRSVMTTPMLGSDLVEKMTFRRTNESSSMTDVPEQARLYGAQDLIPLVQDASARGVALQPAVAQFAFVTANAIAQDVLRYSASPAVTSAVHELGQSSLPDPFHEARVKLSIAFPDKRLLQYDCGKLQRLAILLRELTDRGSRALIFTQMTAVLDILERFLNIHGYKYMRLDGSTRIEQRQDMMERFNRDERIDVFILSSRSGGVGMNLTGADSVIFYDLDWNPQMDKQCQDRAHRIGQTRDVHIYKLVSEHTIEVNILKKSNQKRMLDEVVIQEGEFTTDFFNKQDDVSEAAYDEDDVAGQAVDRVLGLDRKDDVGKVLASAEDVIDVEAAKAQQKEANIDDADFDLINKRAKLTASGTATPAVQEIEMMDGEEQDPDLPPHIDDYMLRFVQRSLEGVPFVPPIDKSKKGRLDKNGRDRSHRPKRI